MAADFPHVAKGKTSKCLSCPRIASMISVCRQAVQDCRHGGSHLSRQAVRHCPLDGLPMDFQLELVGYEHLLPSLVHPFRWYCCHEECIFVEFSASERKGPAQLCLQLHLRCRSHHIQYPKASMCQRKAQLDLKETLELCSLWILSPRRLSSEPSVSWFGASNLSHDPCLLSPEELAVDWRVALRADKLC